MRLTKINGSMKGNYSKPFVQQIWKGHGMQQERAYLQTKVDVLSVLPSKIKQHQWCQHQTMCMMSISEYQLKAYPFQWHEMVCLHQDFIWDEIIAKWREQLTSAISPKVREHHNEIFSKTRLQVFEEEKSMQLNPHLALTLSPKHWSQVKSSLCCL